MEFGLCILLGTVIQNVKSSIGAMYCVRSEGARVDIAEALLMPKMQGAGLSDQYIHTMAEMRFCKGVRNQYAHAHWMDVPERLQFFNLENIAKSSLPNPLVNPVSIDVPLLRLQENHFGYVDDLLTYLEKEYCRKALGGEEHDIQKPRQERRPKLHIPRD